MLGFGLAAGRLLLVGLPNSPLILVEATVALPAPVSIQVDAAYGSLLPGPTAALIGLGSLTQTSALTITGDGGRILMAVDWPRPRTACALRLRTDGRQAQTDGCVPVLFTRWLLPLPTF